MKTVRDILRKHIYPFTYYEYSVSEKDAEDTIETIVKEIDAYYKSKVPKKKDNKAIYEQYFQGEYEWVNDKGNMVMLSKAVRAVEQAIADFHKE